MNNLSYEKWENTGILTINRPDKLNALNSETLKEILIFLTHQLNKENIAALILTGAGQKAFVAGADIKEMSESNHVDIGNYIELGQKVSLQLEQANVVTIAAVNGFALGGGLEMALACDFIYAANNAVFGLPEVSLGLIPGFGGTQRLARCLGTRLAKEMVFTGKKIDSDTALRLRLVNEVHPQSQLIENCKKTALKIGKNGPFAVKEAKKAINNGIEAPIHNALELEKQAFQTVFATEDRIEGINAFLEKRSASFSQ